MQINTDQLKRFIVESGLRVGIADIDAVEKAATASGIEASATRSWKAGKIKDSDLRRIEAYVLGIPFVMLKDAKIDPAVLSLIPESIARGSNIIAFSKKTGDQLEVAMLDVDDLPTIDFVKKKTGLKIMPSLTDDDSIKAALCSTRESLKAEFDSIIQSEARDGQDGERSATAATRARRT